MLSKCSQYGDVFLIFSLVGCPLTINFCDMKASDSCRMNWCWWWCCWNIKIAPPCEINWYCVGGIIAPSNLCAPPLRVNDCDIALLQACGFKFLSSKMLVCRQSAWWSELETWLKLMHTSWWLTNGHFNFIVVSYLFFRLGVAVPTTSIAGVDVVDRVKCWNISIVFFVLTVESTGTNDGNSWRLCSGRFGYRKIDVGFLFLQSVLAVQTTAIAGVYVAVWSSVERITSGVVLVY